MVPQHDPSPLPPLGPEWSAVQWILTDVDDTLTLHGRLPPESLIALERLRQAGLKVVAVTGACAGWCDHLVQAWPLDAVIGENGAFILHRDPSDRHLKLETLRPLAQMRAEQATLRAQIEALLQHEPDLSLTLDQPYRLCEVAIDIGQHRPRIEPARIESLLHAVRALGVQATASSIHINAWQGDHSKRSTALAWLARHGVNTQHARQVACCIGDSPNDQGLFEVLPLSAGVANIRRHWERLTHRPAVVMQREGGLGFAQFAELLLGRIGDQAESAPSV